MANGRFQDILKVSNLTVKLGGNLILNDISLNVKSGEILGVVGVSGAGKTTLLNSIIGYCPIVNGEILFYSPKSQRFVQSAKNPNYFKALFGFSAQNPSFYQELSVLENLEYFASLYNVPENIKNHNIKKALKLVNLEEHSKAISKNLSGGMKKRLDIACAIVHNPRILILDEPTSDMDPPLRLQMWGLMERINRAGTTIILASHFLSEIENMCDTIIFINNKKIKFAGSAKDFRSMHSKTKEIHIITTDGKYDLVLEKVIDIDFLKIAHVNKKKGHIILHSNEETSTIKNAISKYLHSERNISHVEIRNPSMDTLFKIFVEK